MASGPTTPNDSNEESQSKPDECEELARSLDAFIRAFVGKLIQNAADADEIAQNTQLHVWRRCVDGEVIDNPRAFAAVVAKRRVIDHIRQRKEKLEFKLRSSIDLSIVSDRTRNAASAIVEFMDALSTLDPNERHVVKKRMANHTWTETAEQLKMPVSVARRHLDSALERLRRLLAYD